MKLSDRGFRKIRTYEGFGKATPDGGCVAYRETINGKLDIWTIGYGCTKGIDGSTRWTKEQAENALRAEIATHEATVTRLVTVDLNQNEFDACVSFDFNTGALGKSSLLKLLNAGDRIGAAKAFGLYNRFGGKPCKALIARRADEAALFLEPTEPAEPHTMPQAVEASSAPPARVTVASAAAAAGAVSSMAADPSALTAKLSAYKELTTVLTSFGPWMAACALAIGAAFWVWKGQ